MRTTSPMPLDDFDPVSRYAPQRAQPADDAQAASEPHAARPPGIETDHDARILDEIELSLRALITANHGGDDDARLSDVSRMAAETIADEPPAEEAAAGDVETQSAETRDGDPRSETPASGQLTADMATVRAAFQDPRTPPWLLARGLEPETVPEPRSEPDDPPWPRRKVRSRKKSNSLFLRFGLAATGAAVVAAVAVRDIPTLVTEYVRGPLDQLSTNAAAVFNEGKSTPLQARMDSLQKDQDRADLPSMRYAVANADPHARAIPVKTETIGRVSEPRSNAARDSARDPARETVMTPWPSPEAARRTEFPHWQPPSVQTPPPAPVPSGPSPRDHNARPLSADEIAMLRKMGDDYIAAGDFVGARGVLERAADAGDASAAFAIASTYDPVVLARFKVRGLEPDIVKAGHWYERARELGSSEAPHRLQAMMAARTN